MSTRSTLLAAGVFALAGTASVALADLEHEWTARIPSGSSLSAGLQGFVVDAHGNSYVTGITGPSSNTDVVTASFAPDGSLRWSATFNGPEDWYDQARGITLGVDGSVYVTGNTPGANDYSNVLVLKYDDASGELLNTIQYSSRVNTSEHGASVASDLDGNIFISGSTNGDGPDVMILKFDSDGNFGWKQTWDGAAWSPYSQDHGRKILVAPDGNPVTLVTGYGASLYAEYVVLKHDALTGELIWEASWGPSGSNYPRDLKFDDAGDIYVTGTALNVGSDRFGTIKLSGEDGSLIWEAYDGVDYHNSVVGFALDADGGIVITGSVDPDGDRSNANDDMYSVRRDATDGTVLWTHRFGQSCYFCWDDASDVIVDPAGHVFLAGSSNSPPLSGDMITLVLDLESGVETDRGIVFGGSEEIAGSGVLRFDDAYNLYNGGEASNYNTGQVDLTVMKFTSLATDLYRMAVPTLVGGANATLEVGNASPSATQYIGYSVAGFGSTPVPPLGIVVDLESPLLLVSGPANANGEFVAQVPVPRGASGRTVWLQAAESGRTTPVRTRTVR